MSWPKKMSQCLTCFEALKAALNFTVVSPRHNIPKKAHVQIAHTQALNGSLRLRAALRAQSMCKVMGGLIRCFQHPCKLISPLKEWFIWLWSSSFSGGGQPWAMCQACTVARYLWTTVSETGSNWEWSVRLWPRIVWISDSPEGKQM